eukprot:1157908-Pelagomonas_calceolata.AAC.7
MEFVCKASRAESCTVAAGIEQKADAEPFVLFILPRVQGRRKACTRKAGCYVAIVIPERRKSKCASSSLTYVHPNIPPWAEVNVLWRSSILTASTWPLPLPPTCQHSPHSSTPKCQHLPHSSVTHLPALAPLLCYPPASTRPTPLLPTCQHSPHSSTTQPPALVPLLFPQPASIAPLLCHPPSVSLFESSPPLPSDFCFIFFMAAPPLPRLPAPCFRACAAPLRRPPSALAVAPKGFAAVDAPSSRNGMKPGGRWSPQCSLAGGKNRTEQKCVCASNAQHPTLQSAEENIVEQGLGQHNPAGV